MRPPETEAAEGGSTDAALDDALVDARPSDPPALVLARARVAGALFGPGAAGGLGRFRVLERLGAGGMGVVYAAYDPELDRGVALKVVRVPARGRDVALAEAKALARLSHPHVVPVYDVGIEGDQVYIVMELVRGETLAVWANGRQRRDILRVYRQAGEALAAAHAAGLVHRDFKPDNALVGRDGRVRVVDFGLACEAADARQPASEPTAVAGTPRYMAPEQAAGAQVTPAADQYSFCVSIAEALTDNDARAPLPRWLAAVIERGRSADPAARFGSMPDLLRALARDPARVRRRRVGLAALLSLVGAAAFLAGRQRSVAPADECGGAQAELAAIWGPAGRPAALARIAGLGPYGRTLAPELERAFAEHASRWTAGHRDACLAHRRGEQSAVLLDRRMACLDRGRVALVAAIDIVSRADTATLPETARAVRAIPDPAACADLDALVADVEPPAPTTAPRIAALRDELTRARVQLAAGRFREARAAATRCVAEARTIGYQPLLAEALLADGHATMIESRAAAVPLLVEATSVAAAAGADALAVEAWARRAWAQGVTIDPAGALAGLDLVEALAARARSGRFARALLYNNVGSVELARDRRDQARLAFERALAASKGVTGPGAVELLVVPSNLALVTDDRARSDELLAGAAGQLAALLGPEHPDTLRVRLIRATTSIVRLRATAELLAPVCRGYALHAGLSRMEELCWAELGLVKSELGDVAGAIESLESAVRTGSREKREVVPYLALLRGDARDAESRFGAAQAELAPTANEPWWLRQRRAELGLGLGRAQRALGELPRARRTLATAVDELASIARDHPGATVERRLGRARVELALTLAALGGEGDELAAVAAAASEWARAAEAPAEEIAALERLARRRQR